MNIYIDRYKQLPNFISFFEFLSIVMLVLIISINTQAQIVSLGCQTEDVAVEDLERKDFEVPSGNTAIHSQGSMHNFTLPPAADFVPCKIITNITIEIDAIGVDLTNLPANCTPTPVPYYYNIALGCPSFLPASCNTANLLGEPNTPTFTDQNLSFNGNFDFGDNLSVDIVPVMNINCDAGQTSLTSDAVILDYEICVTVTVEDAVPDATVELGPNVEICSDATTIIDAGTFMDYNWSPGGEITPTITVGEGTYNVTVTDNIGCTSTDVIIVSESADLLITFDPVAPTVCDNAQISVSIDETYMSYNWSTSDITQSVMLTPGTYDVTVTDASLCTAVNSITVENVVPPNAGMGTTIDVCNDGTSYNIDDLLSTHDEGGTWSDDNGSGVDININPTSTDFNNVIPGSYSYTYTVIGMAPCPQAQATIIVEVYEQNDAGTSDVVQLCTDPGDLDFNSLIGSPAAGGTWFDINAIGVDLTNPFVVNFNGIPTGTYNFEYVLNPIGPCQSQMAMLTIIILDGALAGQDNFTTVCEGTQFDLQDLILGANGPGTFFDIGGSGALVGSIFNTNGFAGQNFNFSFIVGSMSSPCGQDEAIFTVNVESSLSAGDDALDSFCTGDDIDLFDVLANEDMGGTFTDVNSSGGLTGNILTTSNISPGTYSYQYQVGDGITCPIDDSEITLTFFEDPSFSFAVSELNICEDVCEDIQIDFTGTPPFNFPIEIYSSLTGNLIISSNITLDVNSYTLTTCNIDGVISYLNDTLSLISDSTWIVTIPMLNDLNCTVDNSSDPDTLIINTISNSVFQIDTSVCITDTLVINGMMFFDGNATFNDTIPGAICDSIININVNFTGADTIIIDPIICLGDSILIEGIWFHETNTNLEINFVNPSGCDSLLQIDVSFYPSADSLLNLEFCSGDSIVVNNVVYNEANPTGTEILMGQSTNGCDSIVDISITISNNFTQLIDDTLCKGEFIDILGNIFDESSPSGQITLSGSGCDTIINIDLSYHEASDNTLNGTFCSDFSISVNGNIYNSTNPVGTEILTDASQFGCDSTVTIDLGFFTPIVTDFISDICGNESIDVNGTTYDISNTTGTEVFVGASVEGCDSTVNILLTVLQTYNVTESANMCQGDSLFLEGAWQFTAGTYVDSLQSIDMCDSIVSTILIVDPCAVDINLSNTDNVCANETNGVITLDILSTIQVPFTITWNGANSGISGSQVIDTNQNLVNISNLGSDTYIISIQDSDGNQIYQGSIDIIDTAPAIEGNWVVIDSILCAGELGSIEFQTTGGQSPYNYNWDPTDIQDSPLAQNINAGEYFLTVTDLNGCTFDTVFTFTEPESLIATVSTISLLCPESNDGQISISDITGGVGPYIVNINGQLTDSLSISGLDTGTYVIDIFDANNCMINFTEELTSGSNSNFTTYTDNHQITVGESVMLDGTLLGSTFTYAWMDIDSSLSCIDCANPEASPTNTTTYSLLITDELGCTQLIVINVEVVDIEFENAFPNVFSPNGDSANDDFIFRIIDRQVLGLTLSVYDRWGNLVFRNVTLENEISWDGTKGGSELIPGVYVYQAIVQNDDGTSEVIMGDVLLIR